MTKTDPKCADLVQAEYERELEKVHRLVKVHPKGTEELGHLSTYALSFDYVEAGTFSDCDESFYRWQLSYGGPQDEFRFFVDDSKKLERVEYWYLDWHDGAFVPCTDEVITGWLWEWLSNSLPE